MNRGLKWVSIWSTIGMFIVLIMGAIVTKTGSGDGCGSSWPLCHGKFAPLANLESLIEYSHRLVSGIVGILVFTQGIWAWYKQGHKPGVKAFAFGGMFFTVLQALLGAAAVVWPQSDAVLALHFGFSLAAFACILLLTILIYDGHRLAETSTAPIPQKIKIGIWSITIYSYVVVYLGAYVRHSSSGLGCTTWPDCNGQWFPGFTGPDGIQFIHRLAASVFLLSVCWLYIEVSRHCRNRKDLYFGSLLSLVLAVAQVLSGAVVVWTKLQLFPALLHNMIISFLFGILCYMCFQTLSKTQSKDEMKVNEASVTSFNR